MSASPMPRFLTRKPAANRPDFEPTVIVRRSQSSRRPPDLSPPTDRPGRIFVAGLLWGVLFTLLIL